VGRSLSSQITAVPNRVISQRLRPKSCCRTAERRSYGPHIHNHTCLIYEAKMLAQLITRRIFCFPGSNGTLRVEAPPAPVIILPNNHHHQHFCVSRTPASPNRVRMARILLNPLKIMSARRRREFPTYSLPRPLCSQQTPSTCPRDPGRRCKGESPNVFATQNPCREARTYG
jgi:hypothetical protein